MRDSVTRTASASLRSQLLWLMLALLFGVPLGIAYSVHPLLGWQLVLLLAAAVVAMLFSLVLDHAVRQTRGWIGRTMLGFFLTLVLLGGSFALGASQAANQASGCLAAALFPLAVGVAAAFALGGRNGKLGRALSYSAAAWLGAAIPILIVGVLAYNAYEAVLPGGDGGIVLPFTIAFVLIGFLLSITGGVLGRLLHSWLLSGPFPTAR